MVSRAIAMAFAIGLMAVAAVAQAPPDKLRVGIIVTLSGPGAVLGQQARDGFLLALKNRGGKLGGREVDVTVVDDELKPDVAVTRVKKLLDSDKVDFVVGADFLERAGGDLQAGDRVRRHVDKSQRRRFGVRRQGVQSGLLRYQLRE